MRNILRVIFLVLAVGPSTLAAQQPEAAVLEVVERLFDGMRAGDTTAMRATLHPDVRLVTTGDRDGVPVARVVPIERWLEAVASADAVLDERLYEPEVRVADNLATVWTFYTLHVDGELSHCGYDAFQLVRTPDGWRIMEVADTRQATDCHRPEPDG